MKRVNLTIDDAEYQKLTVLAEFLGFKTMAKFLQTAYVKGLPYLLQEKQNQLNAEKMINSIMASKLQNIPPKNKKVPKMKKMR